MSNDSETAAPGGQFLVYQAEDGKLKIDVRFEGETVWLTQQHMAELFQRERSVITKHIRNIFAEGELVEEGVCANFARTATDGKTYQTLACNLDVIISVGYRVKSLRHVAPLGPVWRVGGCSMAFPGLRFACPGLSHVAPLGPGFCPKGA